MSTENTAPNWGTMNDAAKKFDVSVDTVRRMISRGDLRAERVSVRRIRVDLDSFTPKSVV